MTNTRIHEMFYIGVEEFLAEHPRRGRTFTIAPFGMKTHMVCDCICMGKVSQVILPVVDGEVSYVFTESNDYADTHFLTNASYRMGLECAMETLDEAVPLYPLYTFHNLWHWMFEGIPRLLIMEKFGYDGVYIIAHEIPFVVDILDLLGIDPKRLRYNDTTYVVRKLMLPAPWQAASTYANNPDLFFFVRDALLGAIEPLPGRKRCFVRSAGGKSMILNEPDVLQTLEKYDFEILVPETLPAREQIRFMTNADFSVMPNGASCALAAMQKKDSGFVELFSHRFLQFMNLFMVKHLDLLYVPLCSELAREKTPPPYEPDRDADVVVDCNALDVIVGNMLRRVKR